MELDKLMRREIDAINKLLRAHGVDAGTRPKWTLVAGSSFIAYGVKLGKAERISNVQNRLPEIIECISAIRGVRTVVRLQQTPLALEVPHPFPQVLDWGDTSIRMPAHYMLAGRLYTYSGSNDVLLTLDDVPHALVAGITGAGKSVLVTVMLSTLLFNTPPADLRVVLVDLKNEDLAPFEKMPHVLTFAGTPDAAMQAIEYVHGVKDARVEAGRSLHSHRLLLVIDEVAELAALPGALDLLGSILSIGRSKRINVVAATQKPTAAVVGSIAKANFTARLVGQVADATEASTATGRKQTGAELLPGRGAFLRIQGPVLERFQSYFMSPTDVDDLCRKIVKKWNFEPCTEEIVSTRLETPDAPVRTGACTTDAPLSAPVVHQDAPPAPPTVHQPAPPPAPVFPLAEKRALEPHEAAEVCRLAAQGMSKNGLCYEVYDAKSSRYMAWIDAALSGQPVEDDGKVIQLRRAQ